MQAHTRQHSLRLQTEIGEPEAVQIEVLETTAANNLTEAEEMEIMRRRRMLPKKTCTLTETAGGVARQVTSCATVQKLASQKEETQRAERCG